jgi:hypothetical protein
MDLGWHQDNPHTEPSVVGRPQRRLIYAVPVVGPKAAYAHRLYNLFIEPTIKVFRVHEAAVKLSRFTTKPLRLNRVFRPNKGGDFIGCAVDLICEVHAGQGKISRRAGTNEAYAKNPAASIIAVIDEVRYEMAVRTKNKIDARVAARRRSVSTPHRVSSWAATGAEMLCTLATAFSSPAPKRPASDIDDEEYAEEMELDTSSESSARADEDPQLQEAIQNSLKPAETSTLAVRKSSTTQRTMAMSMGSDDELPVRAAGNSPTKPRQSVQLTLFGEPAPVLPPKPAAAKAKPTPPAKSHAAADFFAAFRFPRAQV